MTQANLQRGCAAPLVTVLFWMILSMVLTPIEVPSLQLHLIVAMFCANLIITGMGILAIAKSFGGL